MTLTPRPVVINAQRVCEPLERVQPKLLPFDERYLQELLADCPDLLPAAALRPDMGQLLCIGREVSAGSSGSIDNLFISTGGYVIIVETKLWRNPQARREVFSQVLDYVKHVVTRDYEWLSGRWQDFANKRHKHTPPLLERLSEMADEELDERDFIDRVNLGLTRGDVLAMIVGDGIQTKL